VTPTFPEEHVPPFDLKEKILVDGIGKSYKYLAWSLSLIGKSVPETLPGYDGEMYKGGGFGEEREMVGDGEGVKTP
jgi:hypothetical protein